MLLTRPLLKYCGNHSLEDIQVTVDSGADYIGVVFAKSKRQVEAKQLQEWLKATALRENQKLVGVFVNPTLKELDKVFASVSLDILQLHGHESIQFLKSVKERYSCPVWKVIHHTEESFELMRSFAGVADGYVIDKKTSSQWGGTGIRFDWSYVPAYIEEAQKQSVPIMIAGGINPENIGDLLPYKPIGIDLSSGIEQDGRKNRQKIEQLEKRLT
ncbi:phosphoribosylanthranilate isomerase [Anaerobacillus sp. MEB173]|uniref:phosphoribosylanthranilate isomerase n=1 Tax=Anaerobacillus sp. MEB173 TaxID=3383345 RepID=UPI003F91CE76